MKLTASVSDTIAQHNLFSSDARVLVAVSGGPDSVALLHCLHLLGYHVSAAHLNHQFRGVESDGDAAFVKDLCADLSIDLTIESIDVPQIKKDQRVSAQQAARSVRYAFLERVRCEKLLDVVATAHNQDDRTETVILNILRGTGPDGLRGIPYRRGNIVRPMLDSPRGAVETFLDERCILCRQDSSNKLAKYARNNVRSELLPYLERRFNPAVRHAILRLSEIAADESDYLNTLASKWLDERQGCLSVDQLTAEPPAFQRRILREYIRKQADSDLSDVSQVLIEQFRRNSSTHCAVTLPGGKSVVESNGADIIVRGLPDSSEQPLSAVPLKRGDDAIFSEYVVTPITLGEQIDLPSLHVRPWIDGDRITLRGGTRKVQDVFTDLKVPREVRRRYPIIVDNIGLVAVGNLRYAVRAGNTLFTIVKAG